LFYVVELERLPKGSRCSIVVEGNPMPFAVGELLMTVAEVLRSGRSGKMIEIKHVFDDVLCQRAYSNIALPNAGFTSSIIHSLNSTTSTSSIVDDTFIQASSQLPTATATENLESSSESILNKCEEEASNTNTTTSIDDMETVIVKSLLLCLKYIVKDQQLPLLVSTLWAMTQR
jgi:hypothetical protein